MKIRTTAGMLLLFTMMTGCSTSREEFQENFKQVMIENIERDFSQGSLLIEDGYKIRWEDRLYTITDTEAVPDVLIGNIQDWIVIDKNTGDVLSKRDWGMQDITKSNQQKRELLQFGMISTILNEKKETAIAVEINCVYYRAVIEELDWEKQE